MLKRRDWVRWASLAYAVVIAALWLFETLLGGRWWAAMVAIALPHEFLLLPVVGLALLGYAKRSMTSIRVSILTALWILFACCSVALPVHLGGPGAQDRTRVQVATYNIAGAPQGIASLRRALEQTQANVICLQEANRWNVTDDLMPGGPAGWYRVHAGELAILSRFPIRSWQDVDPQVKDSDRGILTAVLDVGSTRVRVVDFHYTLLFHGTVLFKKPAGMAAHIEKTSRIRREETDALIRLCSEGSGPLVLAGDFNGPPRDTEIRRLTSRFVDAFGWAGIGLGHTFDDITPMVRIDYIMTTPDIAISSCRVLGASGSDHLPVSAGLLVP